MSGFVKLNRGLNKWGWKTDPNMVALWVHLLTNASYEKNEFMGIKLEPGQLVTGRKKLSCETGISQRTIRTCLKYLKSTNEVTIKATPKYTIITITKWKEYQGRDQVSDQQVTSKRPTSDQQVTTTKEGIRNKEGKEEEGGASAKYAFSGNVIRLNQSDFDAWKLKYNLIPDFVMELELCDLYYTEKPIPDGKWFFPASAWMQKEHIKRLEAKQDEQNAEYKRLGFTKKDIEQFNEDRRNGELKDAEFEKAQQQAR